MLIKIACILSSTNNVKLKHLIYQSSFILKIGMLYFTSFLYYKMAEMFRIYPKVKKNGCKTYAC